jgi:hypothetical protein
MTSQDDRALAVVEPAVPVRLEVRGAGDLTSEVTGFVTREIAAQVREFGAVLGLALEPAVTLAEAGAGGGDKVTIRVNGQIVGYPAGLPVSLRVYLGGFELGSAEHAIGQWLAGARDPGDAQATLAGSYLGLLAVHAIEGRPSVLLPESGVRVPGGSATDARAFEQAQRALLDLGLYAGEPDEIAAAVRAASSGTDAAERLAADRSVTDWLVLVNAGYLKELSLSDISNSAAFIASWRQEVAYDLGMPLPAFRFQADAELPAGCFRFRLNEMTTAPLRGIPADQVLLVGPGTGEISGAVPVKEHLLGPAAALLPAALLSQAQRPDVALFAPPDYLAACLYWVLGCHTGRLVDLNRVSAGLDHLAEWRPAQAAMVRRTLPQAGLTRLLRELVGESVPVRNLTLIADLMLEYEVRAPDRDRLAWVRTGLAETIGAKVSSGFRQVTFAELPADIQELAVAWLESGGKDDATRTAFLEKFTEALRAASFYPLLASAAARRAVYLAARDEYPYLVVVAPEELPADFEVNVLTLTAVSAEAKAT